MCLFIIILLAIFNEDSFNKLTDYPTGGGVTKCESETTVTEVQCKLHSTDDYVCCYAEYSEPTRGKKCFKIDRHYRFALHKTQTFTDESNNTYSKVSFYCSQEVAWCGTRSPSKIFQCREHSSTSLSCCYIDNGNKSDCALANSKFDTIGSTVICCGGYKVIISYIVLISIVIIIV